MRTVSVNLCRISNSNSAHQISGIWPGARERIEQLVSVPRPSGAEGEEVEQKERGERRREEEERGGEKERMRRRRKKERERRERRLKARSNSQHILLTTILSCPATAYIRYTKKNTFKNFFLTF